jgi:hypothetical protein
MREQLAWRNYADVTTDRKRATRVRPRCDGRFLEMRGRGIQLLAAATGYGSSRNR